MMKGIYLPGNSTVEIKEYPVPEPGYGQVRIKMKASSICGSDIRAIYREHLGKGPEGYLGVIAGHEPSGQVEAVGPGVHAFKEGDRVIVYHISGCGRCHDCRSGYQISCSSERRAAYGWQRDGGHAEYMLAEEADLVLMPDSLSYVDGALCACGFGTAYEALKRVSLNGTDRLLVTGLGPVGLSVLMLARAMGIQFLAGIDTSDERVALTRELGLADQVAVAHSESLGEVLGWTEEMGFEVTADCSGHADGRQLALRATRQWGRCVFVGEGGTVTFEPSRDLIHKQITLYGSWVTSVAHLEELVEKLGRWGIHPEDTVTHRFPLEEAGDAYELMDEGHCGKVVIVFE